MGLCVIAVKVGGDAPQWIADWTWQSFRCAQVITDAKMYTEEQADHVLKNLNATVNNPLDPAMFSKVPLTFGTVEPKAPDAWYIWMDVKPFNLDMFIEAMGNPTKHFEASNYPLSEAEQMYVVTHEGGFTLTVHVTWPGHMEPDQIALLDKGKIFGFNDLAQVVYKGEGIASYTLLTFTL